MWNLPVSCFQLQGPRSKFSSGGAKGECVKENFLLNYFLFNLFLFLQKSGGGGLKPPQPLPLRGPWIELYYDLLTRSLPRMLYVQNIQLYTESKSFLERIIFFKLEGDSFKGIQQRPLQLLVTRTPFKHFFKCHLKFLQAKQILASETEAALPGQQNLFRVLLRAKWCKVLHNNILNNFQKVIKRRNIDWKKKRYVVHWSVLPLQRTFHGFFLWEKHRPAWNNVSDVINLLFNVKETVFQL